MATFTDNFVKSQKARATRYTISEGRGFVLQILPSGTKTFQYRYKLQGKQHVMALGVYPRTSLAEARRNFNLAYDTFKEGKDPREVLTPAEPEVVVIAEASLPSSEQMTISKLMELFITKWSEVNHSKRWSRANRLCLEKDLIPEWGERLATDLKPKDAYQLIDRVATRAPASARNLIKAATAMYDYALRNDYVEGNPFLLKFSKHSPKIIPKSRERVLTETELRYLWKAIEEGPGTPEVKRAIKLVLVTAQRPGEVAGMKYSEIEGDWWTIPAERIKTEKKVGLGHEPRPHIVYLTATAKELIGEPGWSKDIVFPAIKGHNKRKTSNDTIKPIDGNALSKRVSRKDLKGSLKNKKVSKKPYYGLLQWQPHDLRRTASTMMNALGIDNRHVEMVLNHSLGKVEGIYNRHQYNEEKKTALLRWEARLLEVVTAPVPTDESPRSAT